MDTGYFAILGLIAAGIAYSLLRKKHPGQKTSSGWIGLGIIAALIVGLVVATNFGNESLTWLFGLSLMLALPLMVFLAIGSAIGSVIRRQGGGAEKRNR